jgi:hypothetical protein
MSRAMIVTGLLLLLIVLGSAVYVATPLFGVRLGPPPTITTTPLHTTVTYAGISVTLNSVQQAPSFSDDMVTNAAEVVRVQLTVENKTPVAVNLLYQNIVRLVLPGGKAVAPSDYIHVRIGLPAGATQMPILDFPLRKPLPARQLVLRLGAANEEQMDIPLIAHPNLSQYAPRTRGINQQLQYFGLNWTVVQVTTKLSIDGQQAPQGMRYAEIAFRVDNTLSQVAIPGSPYGYVALKVDNVSLTPVYSTLPVSFAAGETSATGTVTFLVPQQATAVTLLLGTQQQNGFDGAVTTFSLA